MDDMDDVDLVQPASWTLARRQGRKRFLRCRDLVRASRAGNLVAIKAVLAQGYVPPAAIVRAAVAAARKEKPGDWFAGHVTWHYLCLLVPGVQRRLCVAFMQQHGPGIWFLERLNLVLGMGADDRRCALDTLTCMVRTCNARDYEVWKSVLHPASVDVSFPGSRMFREVLLSAIRACNDAVVKKMLKDVHAPCLAQVLLRLPWDALSTTPAMDKLVDAALVTSISADGVGGGCTTKSDRVQVLVGAAKAKRAPLFRELLAKWARHGFTGGGTDPMVLDVDTDIMPALAAAMPRVMVPRKRFLAFARALAEDWTANRTGVEFARRFRDLFTACVAGNPAMRDYLVLVRVPKLTYPSIMLPAPDRAFVAVPTWAMCCVGSPYCARSLDGTSLRITDPGPGRTCVVHRCMVQCATTISFGTGLTEAAEAPGLEAWMRKQACSSGVGRFPLPSRGAVVVYGDKRIPDGHQVSGVVAATTQEWALVTRARHYFRDTDDHDDDGREGPPEDQETANALDVRWYQAAAVHGADVLPVPWGMVSMGLSQAFSNLLRKQRTGSDDPALLFGEYGHWTGPQPYEPCVMFVVVDG